MFSGGIEVEHWLKMSNYPGLVFPRWKIESA